MSNPSCEQGGQAKVRDMVSVDMGWLTREGRHLTARAKIPEKKRPAARICRRFFTALVLHDVTQEVHLLLLLWHLLCNEICVSAELLYMSRAQTRSMACCATSGAQALYCMASTRNGLDNMSAFHPASHLARVFNVPVCGAGGRKDHI
jgi:hypothetical protein